MYELRCYTFTLFQLSPIQQGIQAGHAAVELVTHRKDNKLVQDWAKKYKTMICLNGGDVAKLSEWINFFKDKRNRYPWIKFEESEASLAGIVTSVAIILPESIFEGVSLLRKGGKLESSDLNPWERALISRLSETPLAR